MSLRRVAALRPAVALAFVAALAAIASAAAGAGSAVNVCPNGSVNFGVEPYDAGAKFTAAYQSLTTVLSKTLNCPVNLIITDNYTDEVEAMKAGKIDVGEFGPLGYIFAHAIAGAQPVAVFADKNGKPVTYTAGLWVPVGSPIKSVADLKGHTVAFSDPGSTSGNLLPRYAMIGGPQSRQGREDRVRGRASAIAARAHQRQGRRGRDQQPAAGGLRGRA